MPEDVRDQGCAEVVNMGHDMDALGRQEATELQLFAQ